MTFSLVIGRVGEIDFRSKKGATRPQGIFWQPAGTDLETEDF
jgi:hypothetical protein